MKTLNLWYDNKIIGILNQKEILISSKEFTGKIDTVSFHYTAIWLNDSSSFALSPNLPLQQEPFTGDVVWNFFENIIPEGQSLYEINKHLQKRRTDLLSFLSQFGKDLPCAFQILPEYEEPTFTGEIQEFSFGELEQYKGPLLLFSKRKSLSLAGAQNKMGAIIKNNKFYIPLDSVPTTHIIKAYDQDKHPNCALNEFIMMELAAKIGITVPKTFYFNNYLIIERYDRINGKRLHQIDLCQYFNRPSEEKYEDYKDYISEDKGLTLKNYFSALNTFNNGQKKLLEWICFNYLIGNTDNHAKNISLLYKNNKWNIAPFYDMVCTTYYDYFQLPYTVNGENNILCINEEDFLAAMEENNISPDKFIETYTRIQESIPDLYNQIIQEHNIKNSFTQKLFDELINMNKHLTFKQLSSKPTM